MEVNPKQHHATSIPLPGNGQSCLEGQLCVLRSGWGVWGVRGRSEGERVHGECGGEGVECMGSVGEQGVWKGVWEQVGRWSHGAYRF